MHQKLINWIVNKEDWIVPTLFKPIQFNVIKKLSQGKKLNDNEKRYLRGKIKQKILVLEELMQKEVKHDELAILLNNIGSYYITGPEALKHNGYGWYYESKLIEVINTKIEGVINFKEKKVRFIRIKSINYSKIIIDKETGLKYATNEQILKDTIFTKNEYTKTAWMQMFKQYGNIFAKLKKLRIIINKINNYL